MYMGDSIQFANLIAAAQAGNVFYFPKLAAPGGQNWLSTAYGSEWMQVSFASALASSEAGPWLAINIYLLFSVMLVTVSTFFASRFLGVKILPAILVALTAGLLRGPFAWAGWPTLQNYAGLILFSAIVVKVLQGYPLGNLNGRSPADTATKNQKLISGGILAATFLVSSLNANYYMWFAGILAFASCVAVILTTRNWLVVKRLLVLAGGQLLVITIALLPIVATRILNHRTLQEISTGDRRAFAALANGGEIPSLFMSAQSSISDAILRLIPPVRAFLDEYQSSPFITDARPRGGLALSLLVLVLALWYVSTLRRKEAQFRPFASNETIPAALLVMVLFVLMYIRGALGLVVAFVVPSLRGFDRVIPLVSIMALMILGLVASQVSLKILKRVSGAALVLCMLDYSSAVVPFDQPTSRGVNTSTTEILANGYEYKSASLGEITRITQLAESKMGSNCAVLVLPVNTYPVDFPSGVVSYLTYDTLKPALIKANLRWSSGAVPDTIGDQESTNLRNLYLNREYSLLSKAGQTNGFCGALVFGSLQNAMSSTNPEAFDTLDTVVNAFISNGYSVCGKEENSNLTLLCAAK